MLTRLPTLSAGRAGPRGAARPAGLPGQARPPRARRTSCPTPRCRRSSVRSGRTSPTSCSTSRASRPRTRELEEIAYDGCALSVVITPVEGLVIESDEVPLGDGLSLLRADDARRRARTACRTTRTRRSPCSRWSPRTAARWSRPASGCGACRPRCACGTTPSPRSARRPTPARTARRGWRSRSGPASAARTRTACSPPRKRTRCARSAASSPAARRGPASWRGRCGASSSAASAASASRR